MQLGVVGQSLLAELENSLPCFRHLVAMLRQLNGTDLASVAMTYLGDERLIARMLMVDALGAAATNGSYDVMRNVVFLGEKPEPELINRAFFQMVTIAERPSRVSVNNLSHRSAYT